MTEGSKVMTNMQGGDSIRSDFFWFTRLFSWIVGAPSILSLIQMVRTDNFRFVPLFQWIVDGYNALTKELSLWIEPPIAALLSWFNKLLGWQLELYPQWRPMFVLTFIVLLAWARILRKKGDWTAAASIIVSGTLGGLIGCIIYGLSDEANQPILAHILAVAPLIISVVVVALTARFFNLGYIKGFNKPTTRNWRQFEDGTPTYIGILELSLIWWLFLTFFSNIPQFFAVIFADANIPSVYGIGFVILVYTFIMTDKTDGDHEGKKYRRQFGWTVLGAFLTAMIILVIDTAAKLFGIQPTA